MLTSSFGANRAPSTSRSGWLPVPTTGLRLPRSPQLGNGDRGNLKPVVGTGSHPLLEVEGALFAPNDDVSIENYRHLLGGALSLLRAVRKSRRQVLASFPGKPVLESASAKSRPAHTFSSSGTRRANGSPFFRSTNVTFW